jgi:transposase
VRLRERLQEDFASRLRQLHRAVDLGFPEFTRCVRTLESQLATTILSRYPTAASFRGASVKKFARIVYDGSHKIGEELARALIEAAAKSVGRHHSEPYRLRIEYLCEDLEVLRGRLKGLARDIERKIEEHEVGKLLTGDPARFRSAGAIASYVGVAPRLRQSGKKRFFSVVLAQPRIASHGVENHHPERLAQASVAQRIVGLPEFCDQTGCG